MTRLIESAEHFHLVLFAFEIRNEAQKKGGGHNNKYYIVCRTVRYSCDGQTKIVKKKNIYTR